jgi:hypothetical protein
METWMLQDLRRQADDWLRTGRKAAHNRHPLAISPDDLRRRRERRRVPAPRVRRMVR